ncbi:GH25 family lysozyme, partial [Salmonella enterica]|uniref:GH25 family lysozyme n=1 Tax=Salmonella enterica TaxID=28901 RepID=UPI003CEB4AFD
EVVTADYGLWVAKYSANEPSVGYWPSYAMWQYTSTPYDANHFYGDLNAWNAYAGKKSTGTTPQPPTPPAPAPVTDTLEGMAAAVQ